MKTERKNAEIPERFYTISDRIKQYLLEFPEGTFQAASAYLLHKHNIILKKGLFYKIRSDRNLLKIDRVSKGDCYRDLASFAHEFGIDALNDVEKLFNNYPANTIIEQLRVIKTLIESKGMYDDTARSGQSRVDG